MRVYGRSPSVVPSLEEDHVVVTDPGVAERMDIMRRTREAYLKAECDEKIKLTKTHKADPLMPRIEIGEEVMYYRDGQKCKRGWHGPARVLEKATNEYTLKQGKAMISCHLRDIRKIRKSKSLFELDLEEFAKIPNQMRRNEETNSDESVLIKGNEDGLANMEKFKKQKCETCGELSVCMSILAPKLNKTKQRDLNTLNAIIESALELSYLCASCVEFWQQQLVYSSLQCVGDSDFALGTLSKILMEASGSKRKAEYKLELVTGDITDDILAGFLTTAKQYGFDIMTESEIKQISDRITFQRDNKGLIPVSKKPKQTFPEPPVINKHEEEDNSSLVSSYEESDEELTGIEDTTADSSLATDQSATSSSFQTISNPGDLPIINETNDLLRGRREFHRERKRETRQKAATSSATVTSPVKTEASSETNNSRDESPSEELVTQPVDLFRQVQFPPDQLQGPWSGQNSNVSSEASFSADDRQTQ